MGLWLSKFRDLNAAIRRMTTLCTDYTLSNVEVEEEIERLCASWTQVNKTSADQSLIQEFLTEDKLAQRDRFELAQLEDVLRICRTSVSLSDAGRKLFAQSRRHKKAPMTQIV